MKQSSEGKKDYKTESLIYDVVNSALNILDTSDLLKDIIHNPNGGCHFTDKNKKLCAKCKLEEVRNQINDLRFKKYD